MTVDLATTGDLAGLADDERQRIVDRSQAVPDDVREQVAQMATRVRQRGEDALRAYTERFDDVVLDELRVPDEVRAEALDEAPTRFVDAFETAVDQIRAYHETQAEAAEPTFEHGGVRARERVVPLERVGAYVPGGTAAYPSTVAMTVVPAQVAGVDEVTLASPPGPDGRPHELVLAAAELLDVDRVLALGGAQAVLGLALGTESLPAQDAVVGPGNVYVQAAKQHVAGRVRIDAPAGPSEVAVLYQEGADADVAARELAAQAEHDPRAVAVALCTSPSAREKLHEALAAALDGLPRRDVAEQALGARGALLTVEGVDEAVELLDAMAPEHCALVHEDGEAIAERLTGPACIVAGEWPRVPFTDYAAGPSHVLPTGGHARAHGGISTGTFTKRVHLSHLDDVDEPLREAAIELARLEGFEAHARALEDSP
jgi:histidinol dehydrogenase